MTSLYLEQRLNEIFLYLQENNSVSVEELSQHFNVSGATIRSDLRKLAAQDLLTRTHGGAILKDNTIVQERQLDPEYKKRIKRNLEYKEKIGNLTANLINENEIIMLDDGSTTLHVAKNIQREKRLTIITNGVNICLELSDYPNIKIISTSGIYRREDLSFNGELAVDTVNRFHADKAILGASGVSLEYGVTGPDEAKIRLKKAMIDNSSKLILVADHTKIERVSLLPVCTLDRISTLVTDYLAPIKSVKQLINAGVDVILAE